MSYLALDGNTLPNYVFLCRDYPYVLPCFRWQYSSKCVSDPAEKEFSRNTSRRETKQAVGLYILYNCMPWYNAIIVEKQVNVLNNLKEKCMYVTSTRRNI